MSIEDRKNGHTILKLKLIIFVLFVDFIRRFISSAEKKEGLIKFRNNLAFVLEGIRCK